MQTTGSRLRLQFPPGVLRLLVGATIVLAVLAVLAGSSSFISGKAEAGVAAKVTVNSRGNTDDGDCEGPPNDNIIGGDCTLREAINDANDGLADLINFHPAVFPVANPGVINIDDDTDGDGCLPAIERDNIEINSENAGVIIDGDEDGPAQVEPLSPITCEAIIHVTPTQNGFDFALMGGKNMTLRDVDGDGIEIDGDEDVCSVPGSGCGLGDVTISGVTIYNVTDDGIDITDVREARNVLITNNDIVASYPDLPAIADEAVDINVEKCFDPAFPHGCIFERDQTVRINDNVQLVGDTNAVEVDFEGDVGNPDTGSIATITVQVNNNEFVNAIASGSTENAVDLEFLGCIMKSSVIFNVDGNTRITSAGDATVSLEVNGGRNDIDDCWILGNLDEEEDSTTTNNGSDHAHVTITVDDNGNIRNEGDSDGEGVESQVFLCCGTDPKGSPQHVVSTSISRNGNIIGESDGVAVENGICCGDDSTSVVNINENGEITGRTDAGVDVDGNYVGETREFGGEKDPEDADGNLAETHVDMNDRITGVNADAVFIDNEAGVTETDGSGDDNVSVVTVNENRRIDGDSDGLDIFSAAGSCMGEADGNRADITVMDNESIDGDDDNGAALDTLAGSGSYWDDCQEDVNEGDDNVTNTLVQGNDSFMGGGDSGINIDAFAGGDTKGSERNTNNVTITENGDIEGQGDADQDDGIRVEPVVCCASRKSNFNNTTITENTKIIGHNGDGIDMNDICCSTAHYVTVIADNDRITGGGDNGIEYTIALGDEDPGDGDGPDVGLSEDLKQDGFFNTINDLTITNNLVQDSNHNGIYICCGPFEEAEQDVKSVISDNIITTNLDHGMEIDSSFGLNIGPNNEIFKNGDNSALDAGIEIDNESSVFDMAENGEFCCLRVVPANHNRITDNSIYDNRGLGIDLVTDVGLDGDTEIDHGVGCDPKSDPINPNDCIDAPVFKTKQQGAMLGTACSLCNVEIFVADNDPADQDDHGEGVGSDALPGHNYIAKGEADADGNWMITLPCGLGAMDLTATATDKVKNTSEFSENISMLGTGPCGQPTAVPTTPGPTATPVTPVPTTNTPVPTNTNTPMPTSTNTPVIIEKACGDVNDNGSVDAVDAQLILQYKAGLIQSLPNLPSADVNDSGEVTSVDAALVLQVEAGLIPLGSLHCPS